MKNLSKFFIDSDPLKTIFKVTLVIFPPNKSGVRFLIKRRIKKFLVKTSLFSKVVKFALCAKLEVQSVPNVSLSLTIYIERERDRDHRTLLL